MNTTNLNKYPVNSLADFSIIKFEKIVYYSKSQFEKWHVCVHFHPPQSWDARSTNNDSPSVLLYIEVYGALCQWNPFFCITQYILNDGAVKTYY